MHDTSIFSRIPGPCEDPAALPLALSSFAPGEACGALPQFSDLIELWLARRGTSVAPDWQDFDFADFRGWHAYLLLGRFDSDAPDPTLRLAGENYIDVTAQNPRGHRVSELVPRLYDFQFRDHFQRIRDEGRIGLSAGRVPLQGRSHVRLSILELPFRDGGAQVVRTLHALAKDSH